MIRTAFVPAKAQICSFGPFGPLPDAAMDDLGDLSVPDHSASSGFNLFAHAMMRVDDCGSGRYPVRALCVDFFC
ncbi:MAG: hypothetical protein ACLGIE_15020, partial [Alphaproteobacteria bacterium]